MCAAFADMAAADAFARQKMEDGTAQVAHSQRTKDGVISVRLLRKMEKVAIGAGPDFKGDWVIATDDSWTP